jgi:hypothetical protein
MNDLLYNSLNSWYDGRIPYNWSRISGPAEIMKVWFDQIKLRHDRYATWIDRSN